jgi:light-regulated signal transduction histidine kinase (bacteriophytochrome)
MDITDRKKAEAELKVHHDHLNELVIMRTMELKSAMENLERSNKELEQFAYVASHDLQEPLRAVVSYLQFLENLYGENLDDKGRSFIAKAVNAAARMQAMITSLLMYSRITTHGKPFIPCDCAAIVKNAILDLQTVIDKRGAVVTCDSLPKIVADESHIERLFQNLIGNGIKFCDIETPMVHISAKTENGAWIFSVKDNGIGIEEQYFGRIFKIFQRLHGRDKYEGTGIGLADCKKIVERHGGRIWVESTPGQGSTFFFTLGTMHQSGNL